MTSAELINQDSGNCEWFTPQPIIKAARVCMGGIDLDPFSSATANQRVQAASIFTREDDGLNKMWFGRVWMNHPYSRTMNKACINKLVEEYESGNIVAACCITFASPSESWFLPLDKRLQCFLHPRTNVIMPDGSIKRGVTKGSCITYFGQHISHFASAFSGLGEIKVQFSTTPTYFI